MLCDAGRGIPGVPHLGHDCSDRNSPQLAHQSSSAPHWAQNWSPGPSGPPHWKQVIVVVMRLPGEAPSGKDALTWSPAAGNAIGGHSPQERYSSEDPPITPDDKMLTGKGAIPVGSSPGADRPSLPAEKRLKREAVDSQFNKSSPIPKLICHIHFSEQCHPPPEHL
jgi:hypothetical protein